MNLTQLRADTPACSERIHLNNAGSSLMPDVVTRTIIDYIELESRIGGYEAVAARGDSIKEAYASVARLIGAHPRNIAFTENATVSYAQALSSIPFKEGDIILTTRNDYASNHIQFLSLQQRFGIQVKMAPDLPEGGVDVGAMTDLIRSVHPTLVAVTHVPTNSGLVQDVAPIGMVCKEEGILYLLDACQSVGQLVVDVQEIPCDFLSATSRKFLRGPRGSGFLYVSDRVLELGYAPLFLDMRGADWTEEGRYQLVADARRFENWEFSWALVLATGAAARYAVEIGLHEIQERVLMLASTLRESLHAIDGVRVLDKGRIQAGIVSTWIEGWEPTELVNRLRERQINTSSQVRTSALLDYDEKGVPGSLRFSPHYYNTEEELEMAVGVLKEII